MDGSNLKMIEALLATYIEKDEHQVRHVAVQYAGEVFPPSHTPSKFVLLLGAGDSKDEVSTFQFQDYSSLENQKKGY